MSSPARRSAILALVLVAIALVIAGCGSSDDKTTATTQPTTETVAGGHGQTIDGVPCNSTEQLNYHVHAHLSLLNNGVPEALPAQIGIVANGQCFYLLHTHDETGVVHIEAPAKKTFTLGQFFDIWGQPLSKDQATNLKGPLHIYVDGKPYTGDPRAIKLTPHGLITIESGKTVPPPSYTFDPGL